MKKIKNMLVLAGCVVALGLSSGKLAAQGRRNFDPAQYVSGIVDQMDIKDDGEKKAVTDAITKVFDARRDIGFGGRGFGGGRRNRGGNSDTNSASADTTTTSQNNNRRGGFGTPSPEMEDLQKAVDAKDTAEIKAKLAKLREVNLAKQAKLEAAQSDLQKLLTSRQEAIAVLNGILK